MAPGQDLEEIIGRLPVDGLKSVIGQDIWMTLDAIAFDEPTSSIARRVAAQIARNRPEDVFSSTIARRAFHDSLSASKLKELLSRLGLTDRKSLDGFDPEDSESHWRRYIGFFGVEVRDGAHFIAVSDTEIVPASYGLFPHQRKAAERVWRKLDGGHTRAILHMPTGAGKTRTAMNIVSRFLNAHEPALVVWLASTSELLDQAADAFQAAWVNAGNRELPLARMWSDYDPDLSNMTDGLVVAGFQKLHALSVRDSLAIMRLAARTKLVVVDEAHQAIAPTYASLTDKLSAAGSHHAVLGLTATPGRTWSDVAKDEKLSAFFDHNKVTLEIEGWENPVDYLMAEGYLARPTFNTLEYEPALEFTPAPTVNGDISDEEAALERLAVDIGRNKAIVAEVERLILAGHKRIILFAASVRHAQIISAILVAKAIDSRVVTGNTEQGERRRIVNAFRKPSATPMVVCNFGVLTTGFDAPNTSAAIIARPTKSLVLYSQMVGRATRGTKAGGNETCEITTVVDTTLPGFGDVSEAFINWEDVWDESN